MRDVVLTKAWEAGERPELAGFLAARLNERKPFYGKAAYRLTDKEIKEDNFNQIIRSHV